MASDITGAAGDEYRDFAHVRALAEPPAKFQLVPVNVRDRGESVDDLSVSIGQP